jgi:anti-sigma factor RsiW
MTRTVLSSPCPEVSLLSRYALGLLAEPDAATLVSHIERCLRCQRQVDSLARQKDGLIDAVRQAIQPTSPA